MCSRVLFVRFTDAIRYFAQITGNGNLGTEITITGTNRNGGPVEIKARIPRPTEPDLTDLPLFYWRFSFI